MFRGQFGVQEDIIAEEYHRCDVNMSYMFRLNQAGNEKTLPAAMYSAARWKLLSDCRTSS